jgi:hypothetical protein
VRRRSAERTYGGFYVDETLEEKAQRWRTPKPVTKQAPRNTNTYTAYERYSLDETPAADNVGDADVEEAKSMISKEVEKADTQRIRAAKEAREEQVEMMQEEDARQAEKRDGDDDSVDEAG